MSNNRPSVLCRVDGVAHEVSAAWTIGRHPGCDVIVAHPEVSGHHAHFEVIEGAWWLVDDASKNGLRVGGRRLSRVPVRVSPTTVWLGSDSESPRIEIQLNESAAAENPYPPGTSTPTVEATETTRTTRPFPLLNAEMVIGRADDCEITIPDSQISRRHALVRVDGSGAVVADLQSHNGVRVNGNRIEEPTPLDPGDELVLGQSLFVYREGHIDHVVTDGLEVRVDDLSVVTGKGQRLVDRVTLTLPPGSMTAIVGPSGSGKSTLLRAITRRQPIASGRILVGGHDLHDAGDFLQSMIGVVPQDDAVHTDLTVSAALTYAARLRLPSDTSPAESSEVAIAVARDLDLHHRLATQVSDLSGGQRKRVSVGYELVGSPKVLLLDEPTSGLDPGLERELMGVLRELAATGSTVVVVTHTTASLDLCDHVAVMAPGGRLNFFGAPEQAKRHFAVDQYDDLFAVVGATHKRPKTWTARPASIDSPSASFQSTSINRRVWARDLRVLTARYCRSLLGDRRRLALLALQAPLLGLLFALVIPTDAFAYGSPPTGSLRQLSMALVLVMIWLGGSNSVREIVDERLVFLREAAIGVSPAVFMISKLLVLSVVTTLQAVVLALVATWRQQDPPPTGVLIDDGRLELVVALAWTGIACVGLGLIVSVRSKDAAKALGILPMVAVSVFLLSGLVVPLTGRAGLEQVGYLNAVQWGASATAATLDLRRADGCVDADAQTSESQPEVTTPDLEPPPACTNPRWERTVSNQGTNLGTLMAWAMTHAVVAVAMAKRAFRPAGRQVRGAKYR